MKVNQFYCVALRKKVTLDSEDICVSKLKNGRYALKGYCDEAKCNLVKFISSDSIEDMKHRFGNCKKSKKRSSKKSKRSSKKSKRSPKKSPKKSRRKSRC